MSERSLLIFEMLHRQDATGLPCEINRGFIFIYLNLKFVVVTETLAIPT